MLEKFSRQTESNLEHLHLPVEHLSARHLNFFGLDIGEVKLFSERQLRNIASRRLAGSRKNRPSSWWTILKQLEVTDALILSQELEFSGGHHSCKAILLSLLESVHAQGFSRLHWVAEPQLFRALSGVSRLLSILKSAEIETSLTQLNFSFEITGDSFYSDLTLSKDNYANI